MRRSDGIYHRLARRLYPFRVSIAVFGAAACGGFVVVTIAQGTSANPLYALAFLTALLWALWLLAVAYVFVDPGPEYDPGESWLRRLIVRLRRGLGVMLSVAMTAMLAVAVLMTIRTVSLLTSA